MNSSDKHAGLSRRSFLLSSGELLSAAWVASHWPAIAAAAEHAEHAGGAPAAVRLQFFATADAADVSAICEQIVPSGATGGAREAHAVYFIDRSLATCFSRLAPDYRAGLAGFQAQFRRNSAGISFVVQFAALGNDGGRRRRQVLPTVLLRGAWQSGYDCHRNY